MTEEEFDLALISVGSDEKPFLLKYVTDAMVQVDTGFKAEYRIPIVKDRTKTVADLDAAGREELRKLLG